MGSHRALISAVLLSLACPAAAQNTVWQSPNTYGAKGDKVWFYRAPVYDTNLAGSLHENATGWIETLVHGQPRQNADGRSYWQEQMHGSVNCPARTMRVSGYVSYLDQNAVTLFSAGSPEFSQPMSVQPGTLGEDLYKYICH